MNVKVNNSGGMEYYNPNDVEREIDRMVELAVKAAAKGDNVEQLQEVMMGNLPAKMRDSLKKKFSAALHKRRMKAPEGEADVPSRNTLSRLRQIFAASAKAAMQRVINLLRSRPDLATQVKQIGQALAKHGVAMDKNQNVTEADLGLISPTAGIGARGAGAAKEK